MAAAVLGHFLRMDAPCFDGYCIQPNRRKLAHFALLNGVPVLAKVHVESDAHPMNAFLALLLLVSEAIQAVRHDHLCAAQASCMLPWCSGR